MYLTTLFNETIILLLMLYLEIKLFWRFKHKSIKLRTAVVLQYLMLNT